MIQCPFDDWATEIDVRDCESRMIVDNITCISLTGDMYTQVVNECKGRAVLSVLERSPLPADQANLRRAEREWMESIKLYSWLEFNH
jgi:hypothetical protein